jgi:tight adherence protein C
MIYLVTAASFIAIALLIWAVLYPVVTRRSVVLERLDKLNRTQDLPSALAPKQDSKIKGILTQVGSKMPLSPRDESKYTKMMVAAGYGKRSVPVFLGSKVLLALAFPFAYVLVYSISRENLQQTHILLCIAALAISGFLLPTYWLRYKLNNRQMQIFHTLPDILDLMTVCVEAGLSMDAALIKTTETPQFLGDPLAQEIKIATRETRAGKPRAEALRDMADRTMVDDVKSFVTMLAQTERFGTSLSQALRVHADSLRTKRRQIAEEAAAKTSVKLIFPLVLFVFPALLVVILGPAIVQIHKLMGSM